MKQLKSTRTKGFLMGIIMVLAVSLFFTACNNGNKSADSSSSSSTDTTVVVHNTTTMVHDTIVRPDTLVAK